MGAVLDCGPKKGSMRYALVAIADNSDDYGFACPSIETIAQKACCDARTAMRLVQALERDGWLKVQRRVLYGKGSVYFIDVDKLGVTVNPKMRRSPLHVEIAKVLANRIHALAAHVESGDKLSPENQTLKEDSGDNPQGAQVTKTPESGDKKPFPILINRCEPLMNPDNTPLPPSQASGGYFAIGAESVELLQTIEAVGKVKRECGWSDKRLDCLIGDALREHSAKIGICMADSAALMVAGWKGYLENKHLLRYHVGERKFITLGWWIDDRAWPWDEALLREKRRL